MVDQVDVPQPDVALSDEGHDAQENRQPEACTSVDAMDTEDPVSAVVPPCTVPFEEAVPDGAQGSTAFFLFSNVHRDRVMQHVQKSLPQGVKATIGMVGKQIGHLWRQCSAEVKAAYTAAAKDVRHQFVRHRMQ
jgi:hypothetical protein